MSNHVSSYRKPARKLAYSCGYSQVLFTNFKIINQMAKQYIGSD